MRQTLYRSLVLATLSLGATGAALAQGAPRAPDNRPPSAWSGPVMLLASQPPANGGELVWTWVAGVGFVEATRRTTASIGQSMPVAARTKSRALEPCRAAAWAEAAKLGARDIEAAPAGAERRDRWGRTVAPIQMRVTYPRLLGLEIREEVVTCTVDKKGNVVAM